MSPGEIDLTALPREYLDSYPYPALVLPVPIPPENTNDEEDDSDATPFQAEPSFIRAEHVDFPPMAVMWSNAKWRNLTHGKPLLECLTVRQARKLGHWLTERTDVSRWAETSDVRSGHRSMEKALAEYNIAKAGPSLGSLPEIGSPTEIQRPRLSRSDLPPPDFWEPERPYEDRSVKSDTGISEAGADGVDVRNPAPSTVIIELERPYKVKLELTKTVMPIWRVDKRGVRSRVGSHTFAVITTTPRSALVSNASSLVSNSASGSPSDEQAPALGGDLEAVEEAEDAAGPRATVLGQGGPSTNSLGRPVPSASTADPHLTTRVPETETHPDIFSAAAGNSRPIMFNRDGTVSRQVVPSEGTSKDVRVMMETMDWSKTALGPRDQWPQSLKTIVALVLNYPHQCCLWWGKDLTLIYNEAYAEMMVKHPHIFGMSGPVAWSEIWNSLGPLSELVLSGTPVSKEDDFLLFKQLPHQGGGILEEYHSWMWVPVLQEDGTFGGLWNATISTTKKVLGERRMATVREMGQRTAVARNMEEFDAAVIEILASNARDVPFAALYHVDNITGTKQTTNGRSNTAEVTRVEDPQEVCRLQVKLAGAVGVPDNHPSTPKMVNMVVRHRLRSTVSLPRVPRSPTLSVTSSVSTAPISPLPMDDDGPQLKMDCWPIKEALRSNRLVLVEDCSTLIEGFSIRVWDELPTAAVVVPITNESEDGLPSAVLVLGLNIRRPFDDDYESFIHVLRLQLASGIAAVRSYEAERQRIDELAALDRAKSLLFSNVSHELRTPLTLIAGPLDDILQEMPEGSRKETLVMARRNVRRLTRLVSTLMDVSRLEAGRLKGSFRPVNLGIMTKDLATLFRGAIEKARLKYEVNCDLTPRDVFIDLEHWEKIVFNLIGNALKYTMSGTVAVTLRYERNEAIFAVQDSGVGIPASDINLVGERFHRVQSVSRSHEGTGIGLALIKELIKLNGGTMSIESTVAEESIDGSHGSTFTVRIPLGNKHLPPDALETGPMAQNTQGRYGQGMVDEAMQWTRNRDTNSVASSDETDNTVGDTNSSGSRSLDPSTLYFKKTDVVLLVDDSFDTRKYIRSVFAPFCSVIEACDGLEALEHCKKAVPDLIISDVMMPNLDGFGLLQALKESKELAIVPIIMLTARGGDEAKVDGLLAGADDYLSKPFNARELIARAHMQMQLGKKRRALEAAFDERTMELRVLSEYSPVGIFRTNEEAEVTYTNPAWHEMSGYPVDTAVDQWPGYIKEEHRSSLMDFATLLFDNNENEIARSTDYQFSNGRWAQLKAIRLDRVAPGMKGVLGVVIDITERKINEESQRLRMVEADQRRREAEEAKRQQELLIDITSHEIRNPISSLMQMSSSSTNLLSLQEQLELVVAEKSTFKPTKQLLNNIEEDLDALESIYQCGLAQERISNDVLSLGKIQLEMFDVEVDMLREAQKVLSIFQNEARMKRIGLNLKLGDGVDKLGLAMVKTDPVRLNQIVTNLLSNAIRFTSTSDVRQIELAFDISFDPPIGERAVMPRKPELPKDLADDQPIYLYFAVTDTGPGMTEAELDLLFQRFSQVSLKTHTIFGGSGLGLFVCRKITELMGGKIDVISTKGQGSTFRFYIKARTCKTAERLSGKALSHEAKRRLAAKKETPRFAGLSKKPHVLIVEDNMINQTVLARQLRHCNVTCDVASNGLEALQKIRAVQSLDNPKAGQSFDCILMDLEMPVMDGLTAVKHIREEEAAGKLSLNLVIALTGNARQGQIDEARASGMDEVIIKPYRLDNLLQKIEAMMKIRAQETAEVAEAVGEAASQVSNL
ncbi:hypothetical protein IAU60_006553 [Kwoniella sp. DSM 27419]